MSSVRGYNRLAPHYRTLERMLFPRGLDRARHAMVDQIPTSTNAIVFGDGDGRLLGELCRRQPSCRFTSIDSSQQMLELQQERVKKAQALERVDFQCHDALSFVPPPQSFDLMVMAFFLDCFQPETLEAVMPRWLSGLQHGGLLYFVDFVHPKSRIGHAISVPYFAAMHLFFRWQTQLPNRRLVDLTKVLSMQPLTLLGQRTGNSGFVSTRLYKHLA